MTSNHSQRARVNDDGNPIIPAEVARQYGIQPGGELFLDEKDDGIFLRRPISHLAKVYVEPTSKCNLSCRTCIRNSWDEPMGQMTDSTFDRVISGILELDFKPLDLLWRFWRTALAPTYCRHGCTSQKDKSQGRVDHKWYVANRRMLAFFTPGRIEFFMGVCRWSFT